MDKNKKLKGEEWEAYRMLRLYEKPYRHGQFGGVDPYETMRGQALTTPHTALCMREVKRDTTVADFTGQPRAMLRTGDTLIHRLGYEPAEDLSEQARRRESLMMSLQFILARPSSMEHCVWLWSYTEDKELAMMLLASGWTRIALKISAASEYRTLWFWGDHGQRAIIFHGLTHADAASLRALNLPRFEVEPLAKQIEEVERLFAEQALGPFWMEHYSHYNRRQSWYACSLKGYYKDHLRIEKPQEMSKSWKAEHPKDVYLDASNVTKLMYYLPEVSPILDKLKSQTKGFVNFQRIRLMKLTSGQGELTRHADITDKEAGTEDGKVMRIHIPITTNPQVSVSSWDTNGVQMTTHFEAGRAFYLDTRKAHTVVNAGPTDRIHLVVDCYANEERRNWLL